MKRKSFWSLVDMKEHTKQHVKEHMKVQTMKRRPRAGQSWTRRSDVEEPMRCGPI